MGVKTGLIGFFDILGYQNILEKNEPEEIANSVIPIMTELRTIVKEDILKNSKINLKNLDGTDVDSDFIKKISRIVTENINSIKWLIFSDTIVLNFELPSDNVDDIIQRIEIFLIMCSSLIGNMISQGLPVRGGIDYGKFYIEDNYLAGKPIVRAYKLSENLEISTCALTENFTEKLNDESFIKDGKSLLQRLLDSRLILDYLTPTKSEELHLKILPIHIKNKEFYNNIRERTLNSFWGHNKDIPISVHKKIENTIKYLEFLKLKVHSNNTIKEMCDNVEYITIEEYQSKSGK